MPLHCKVGLARVRPRCMSPSCGPGAYAPNSRATRCEVAGGCSDVGRGGDGDDGGCCDFSSGGGGGGGSTGLDDVGSGGGGGGYDGVSGYDTGHIPKRANGPGGHCGGGGDGRCPSPPAVGAAAGNHPSHVAGSNP